MSGDEGTVDKVPEWVKTGLWCIFLGSVVLLAFAGFVGLMMAVGG